MSDVQNGAAITRTMEREFWNGIPVVAYHWNILDPECPIEGLRERHAIAYHWSTGPVDAARLISVNDVEAYLSTPAPSDQAGLEKVRWIVILREWFGAERYARDYEYLDANYGKQAKRVANFLNARTAPTLTAGEGGVS